MPLPPWVPELAALDLFLSVAEHGSVGKAAAAHGISQPSASARLSRLERRVGISLLVRTTTGTTLTPAGAVFAAWADDVVQHAAALAENVTTLRETRSARLRIVASLTVAEYLLPAWLLALRHTHPDVDVVAEVANSHEVAERVRAGRVELGFVETPVVPPGLSSRAVGVDRLALLAAPGYPAARRREPIRARDLLDQPLLLREHGSGTRETFVHALGVAIGRDPEPELRHAIELGSTATILATARAGGGIGVVSARATPADGTLVEISVADLDATRTLHAVWTGRQPPAAARLLVDLADARLAP